MSYKTDAMSAYYESEMERQADERKQAQKKIADDALKEMSASQKEVDTTFDNGMKAAYIQSQQSTPTTETGKLSNQVNYENIVSDLTTQKENANDNMDNQKALIKANMEATNANIDAQAKKNVADYELGLMESEIQAEKDAEAEEEKANKMATWLTDLNKLSKDNGYNYDFDSDLYELRMKGYSTTSPEYLTIAEAKRQQTQNRKTVKASAGKETDEIPEETIEETPTETKTAKPQNNVSDFQVTVMLRDFENGKYGTDADAITRLQLALAPLGYAVDENGNVYKR